MVINDIDERAKEFIKNFDKNYVSDPNFIGEDCDKCGMWVKKTHECNPNVPVQISFPLNKNKIDEIFDTEEILRLHNIKFDTGTGFGHRDWSMEMLGPEERREVCKIATISRLIWEVDCACDGVNDGESLDDGIVETHELYRSTMLGGE